MGNIFNNQNKIMDEKVIKRLNIAFIVAIVISIIIPLISALLFSLLASEEFPQWYRDLILYGGPVLSLILFVAGLIAYIIGCANLASAKGHSRILGFVGLLPVFGILILVFSKDKNKNEAISFGTRLKKIYLAALLVAFLPIVMLFATPYLTFQMANYESESEIKEVQLVDPVDTKKITYETDNLIITFGLDDFQANMKIFFEKNSHMKENKEIKNILAFVNDNVVANSEVNLSNAPKELQQRIHYTVANLLESGKFTLFDIKNNKYIKKIKIETYGDTCGPLCGSGGRRFIVPNYNLGFDKVFFETMDWIS